MEIEQNKQMRRGDELATRKIKKKQEKIGNKEESKKGNAKWAEETNANFLEMCFSCSVRVVTCSKGLSPKCICFTILSTTKLSSWWIEQ